MSFKENLLKKIQIDKMAENLLGSIGPPGATRRVDQGTMRRFLEACSYPVRKERDLELYILSGDIKMGRFLVLDNDLAIYKTSVKDILIRKSPTIKEMISIRNAVKILRDSDVVISKKAESVKTIRKECIGKLDLSFDRSDLDTIAKDGVAALERKDRDGVLESLSLFAELLEYTIAPRIFQISNHHVFGLLTKEENGRTFFGPIVIYGLINNQLKLVEEPMGSFDKEKIEFLNQVAIGKEKASGDGPDVFRYLKEMVLRKEL